MKHLETFNNYIIFNKLKNYIITNDNVKDILRSKDETKKEKSYEKNNNFKPYLVYPKQFDKFFWCFYIFNNSVEDYKLIDNKHFLIEKTIKLDFVKKIRENPSILKENKIKKIETELDIANSKRISINSFFFLCLYHHINVIVLCNNIYYEFMSNNESPINVIDISSQFIGCAVDVDSALLNTLLKDKIYVENPDRPIRSIGFYKVSDLQEYSKKLSITVKYSNGKQKKKQELYDEIKNFFV